MKNEIEQCILLSKNELISDSSISLGTCIKLNDVCSPSCPDNTLILD
jgi:hypothetical protein